MSYCTENEVRQLLKDDTIEAILSDQTIEDAEEKEEKIMSLISKAIKDADAEIDGYIQGRYSAPLTSPPTMINKTSKDIALFNLHSRIGINEDDRENVLIIRYRNAIKYLENVAKGNIDLLKSPQYSSNQSSFKSNNKLFSRDSLRSM